MDERENPAHSILAAIMRLALVIALAAAVWSVYRRLPHDERSALDGAPPAATNVRIILRRPTIKFPIAEGKVPVQLYPINMSAARSEYESERRPGVRFEDFVMRQMGNRQPIKGELDERGEGIVAIPPGRWWVHASVAGEQELTWRLPVNATGREVMVELTYENAYLRAKRF